MIVKYVYLGRFAPFHIGHERLLNVARKRFGEGNCLCLIGSSSSLNERTPYTFETRMKMVQAVFPNIKILPLPDVQPELKMFDGSTNDLWLDSIERLASSRDEKWIFVGGSKDDLKILAQRFETILLVDRESVPISATKIREALRMINPTNLSKVINFDF